MPLSLTSTHLALFLSRSQLFLRPLQPLERSRVLFKKTHRSPVVSLDQRQLLHHKLVLDLDILEKIALHTRKSN